MTESRCPVVHFDHNSQEHSQNPPASYKVLRESTPVAWSEAHGGYWILSDYASVFDAARDDATFTSRRTTSGGEGLSVVIPKTPMHLHIPIEMDPPEFRKYRKLINPITAPAATERLLGLVTQYTTWFIDRIIETGQCDMASVIAVPAVVTVDWLGLPAEDWKNYAEVHHQALTGLQGTPEFEEAMTVGLPAISEQMRQVIHQRRLEPQDDAISFLVQQEVDDRPVTEEEVFSIVELLIAGGTGTTASLVSQTVVWLYDHQDVRQDLIEHPEKLDKAIEEFLRYFSPTQALARTVTHDVEFHGCALREEDRVLLAWSSANRDESMFPDADEVDIERWPNRHLAFGVGIHRCAGSHLGRAMARELLGQILGRMGDYVIDKDGLAPYTQQGTNTGWKAIPATFTPGRRIGPDLGIG
ncbi:MAG: cytochrome P450 [Frankiales bacterium]|nr:cytochrome P450 [Frankiales bacterium]